MNQFLRSLTPTQQVGALFLIIFGILVIISAVAFLLTLREQREGAHDAAWHAELKNFRKLLATSWFMVVIFWVAWAAGEGVATVLFALIAFFALREFITLSPTRRGDHRSLVLAFFVVLPIQFWLAGTEHFDLFTVFIPVYVFLAIPVVSAHRRTTPALPGAQRQAAVGHHGVHLRHEPCAGAAAAGLSQLPGRRTHSSCSSWCWWCRPAWWCSSPGHARLKRPPSAPNVSKSFNWRSWWHRRAGSLLGGLLSFITPFKPGQALAMAFVACVAGSLGHLVMKALKRDRGITELGPGRLSVTGANGLLDRVDALCFAAPVFFHSVRWYFGAVMRILGIDPGLRTTGFGVLDADGPR
jgi:phosphatidate cytidylyltransferase